MSSKPADRKIKESKTLDDIERTDEREWEGFGEEKSEARVDVSRAKGKDPVAIKASRNPEKKRRKQDQNQKKQEASLPNIPSNAFEALSTVDEGGDSADEKESDGKQEGRTEEFFCL